MTNAEDSGIEVVLVEDNLDDARFVEQIVLGHQSAHTIGNGPKPIDITNITHVDRLVDGLEQVRTEPPDVVLLDLMLPDSMGIETVERMVEQAPMIPVVVLTGRNEIGIGVRAIQRGAEDYLVKGTINEEVLLRTLRYAIERKQNHRDLLDRNHRLALLNQIVSHDIRNDMSMVVGFGDQIRDQIDTTDETAIDALLDAAEHVVELTDTASELIDVLSTTKLEHEPYNLVRVVDAEVARLRREADMPVTINWDDSDHDPVTVYASPMLASVIKHLLSNAVTHSNVANPQITVSIKTGVDHASVEIADDGVGIPDRQKELLIDPNVRFTKESGIGVGLYLVTTVLNEIDAEFEIDDNYPQGTIVTVTLDRVNRGKHSGDRDTD
ncbi:hybrid sensor histidine kinase/response regulator [Halomontanus rarus]|uniref:hybrid sensor histidine kinase/response regulator n=1 Tax=Halomontanus rarus TaxID=3034020 RepID=UPI0023E7AD5E|nr:hybrid sensor histidine kinase/response regulator [Halovivax sp. TS33]